MQLAQGFSLVELLVVVGVLALTLAIAIPAYRGYVETAHVGVMQQGINGIRLLQAERRAQFGEFAEGVFRVGAAENTLQGRLGFAPAAGGEIDYVVTCATAGDTPGECVRASGYTVTATHADAPLSPHAMTFDASNTCTSC